MFGLFGSGQSSTPAIQSSVGTVLGGAIGAATGQLIGKNGSKFDLLKGARRGALVGLTAGFFQDATRGLLGEINDECCK